MHKSMCGSDHNGSVKKDCIRLFLDVFYIVLRNLQEGLTEEDVARVEVGVETYSVGGDEQLASEDYLICKATCETVNDLFIVVQMTFLVEEIPLWQLFIFLRDLLLALGQLTWLFDLPEYLNFLELVQELDLSILLC